MNDYDFHKDTLKPTKAYNNMMSPKNTQKQKATTERSKSKQKMIVTSFSKKQLAQLNVQKYPISNGGIHHKKVSSIDSPSYKKNCQSEYYIKTAETKTQLDQLQLQDQLRMKDGQLEALTKRLAKAQTHVNQLMIENKMKNDRIQNLEREMNTLLAKSLKSLQIQHIGNDLAYQVQKYRQDQRRLLKMLQNTTQYQYFSKFALMDDGVSFLRQPSQLKKSALDADQKAKKTIIHFCSCNKDLIAESTFWVPEKMYSFGKEFITQRKGQFTKSEFELLLYELNRLWREREKKIINTLNGQKARELSKYKRRQATSHSLQKNSVYK